jgi:SAM-dependent methyltransferase
LRRRLFGLRWRWERLNNKVYDWRHGTDTHQECFLNTQGVTDVQALQGNDVYRPFWRKEFYDAIRALDVDLADYLFIDIGSGKGKLLLLASRFPFSRIVGVEYAPALHAIALNNIRQCFRNKAAPPDITSVNADAMTWELPARPAVYFLYNPFDLQTTRAFFARLDEHVARTRVPTFMIYGNLRGVAEREAAFASARSLVRAKRTPRFLIHAAHHSN